MKTFKQYLIEMPIPKDWNPKIFDQSFAKIVKYANANSIRISSGSSRIAYEIMYEGRPTVLKIAKNRAGLAQNKVEGDWSIYKWYPDITVPLIDKDEEADEPRWLHVEKAEKFSKPKFKSLTGFDFENFRKACINEFNKIKGLNKRYAIYHVDNLEELRESDIFQDVIDISISYTFPILDIVKPSSWGFYQNKPVIIDLGLNSSVYQDYYKG